ncbi:NADH:flavin oxidoreductase/NADH oxidase [Microcella alkalica]|uniref:NADH:flavin oxidoreductase/NADH oxidase n=1 Tax=Microcella alkalica TaxID=355930 RepID=UPI00145EB196|nr:NADH:flavin oxidoreductase/NADH oxidase [Microcella alkalica]
MTTALFSPLTVRDLTLRNRVWVAPLCEYSVPRRDGVPTDWHLVHLGSFARGGAGLVIAEATAVVPEGRISPHDTGIWNDEQAEAWRRVVDFIHGQGAAAGIQLAHAGRKASIYPEWGETVEGWSGRGTMPASEAGWQTVAPSAIAFEGYDTPVALDEQGIADVVAAFADAARRSVAAGFDLVEVHAAHGYLLHQFLSPLSNLRDDAWGGSLEHRARIVLDVVRAVRAAVDVPILVRFSATDWTEGGWDEHQTATVAQWALEAGADLFDISSGGLVRAAIPVGPGYQVPLAEHVRREGNVAVGAVGLITEAEQAERIVATGQADAILMGRQWMRDPHAALSFARALGDEAALEQLVPPQYRRAFF